MSKYSFGKFGYNFEDPESPTKLSSEESKKSKQSIDLEDVTRYEFHNDTKRFFYLKQGKFIHPEKVVENIYTEHLNTVKI